MKILEYGLRRQRAGSFAGNFGISLSSENIRAAQDGAGCG